jgi:hypothetical protein
VRIRLPDDLPLFPLRLHYRNTHHDAGACVAGVTWGKVNDYHAKSGPYTLAKGFVHGVPRYVLYDGGVLVRGFESSSEASAWITSQTAPESAGP